MGIEVKKQNRLAQVDPWEVTAEARQDRARMVARWISSARLGRPRPPSAAPRPWPHLIRVIALLPLGAGYFMSYLFRNVNGTVAGDVMRDLGVGAGALGLLTSIYFLTFAAAQLPIGVLLDRWGPRSVQTVLFAITALGAGLCALDMGMPGLLAGRALIGLGTAGGLVAGLKAAAEWFPRERLPLVNGTFIMCGGFGALAATWPVDYALRWTNWRGLFFGLGLGALAIAVAVYVLVPANRGSHRAASSARSDDLRLADVLRDPFFRSFAPLSASCFGAVLALQGLWAGPFLAEVNKLSRPDITVDLAAMAMVLILAAPLWGVLTSKLRRRMPLARVAAFAGVLLITAEASTLLPTRWPALAWCVIAVFGGMTVLSYSILAEHFPKAALGRANAALNVLHIGTAFVLQLGIGQIVSLWPVTDGHSPPEAYEIGLLVPIALQILAVMWLMRSRARTSDARKATEEMLEGQPPDLRMSGSAIGG